MLNWKEIPFVRFLVPFAFGISLAAFLENNHPIWYGSLFILVVIRIILTFRKIPYRFRIWHGIIANFLLFLIGYLWCFHYNELQVSDHFQKQIKKENIIIGKVANVPEVGKYVKASLTVQYIGNTKNDSLKTAQGNLLVYLKNDSITSLNYDDLILLKSSIQPINSPQNPHAFNYQRYLHFQNIHYQAFVNSSTEWKILQTSQRQSITKLAIQVRQYFIEILEHHLPSPNEFAVGKALIVGQKDDLDESLRTAYAHTGALHVLAVSGLHVGLVAWFVNILLSLVKSRTWTWRIIKMFILIGVVWSFALIAGGSPSVLRAATMFTFLIIGLSVNRTTNIYNSLAISASFLLVWNPYLLFNVGFQLSYLAILGIVFFQPKIFARWFIKNSLGRGIWKLASVSLGAQIGTLPISIYYFHSFPFFAWLSGIIVIPAATIILGSGLLLLLTHTLIPMIAFIPGTILHWSIWSMNQAIFFIQNFPLSVLKGLWIGLFTVLIMYSIIGNIILLFNTKNYRWLLPAAGLVLLLSINYSFTSFKKIHQRKITIYHSYKNSIIDFFDKKNGVSISNKTIDQKSLNFTTQNNRWASGVQKVIQLHFDSLQFQNENSFFQHPFIQFFDKKIVIISDDFQFKNHQQINVDFILIRNNPTLNIEDISKNFTFDKIIFDCSNSSWKVEQWKSDCKKLNFHYYDIFEKGAFEISLE